MEYEFIEIIGYGKTAQVWSGKNRSTGKLVAIKCTLKAYITTCTRREALEQEWNLLTQLRHPTLCELYGIYKDKDKYSTVMEYVDGSEIMTQLYHPERVQSTTYTLSEAFIAGIIRDIASLLVYLHSQGITHRDIKPENIMLTTTGQVKIIDFGVAYQGRVPFQAEMQGLNGTSQFMAPEMFQKDQEYCCKIDIWALGVVTFVLLSGQYPFDGKFMSQIEDQIIAGQYTLPLIAQNELSPKAKKFIAALLVQEPAQRPTAEMVLRHPWLQSTPAAATGSHPFSKPHLALLEEYTAHRQQYLKSQQQNEPFGDEYVPPSDSIVIMEHQELENE